MWTVEVIKARFFEAADVERRMYVKGMSGGGNAWPSYLYEAEDISGWDDQAKMDQLERWQGRKFTKTPELTRWEEVFFEWTQLIPEKRRLLVWRWAQCIASGRSFSKYCQDKGLVRMTAYNRMERVFENLVARFSKDARLLRMPDPKWDLHLSQPDLQSEPTIEKSASAIKHPPFLTERATDTLKTPDDMARFIAHLEDVNDKRRKDLLRRLSRSVAPADAA